MATTAQCRTAMDSLAAKLAANAAEASQRLAFDRRILCTVTDLGVSYRGRLHDGQLTDIAEGDDPQAQIRLSLTSDDLVALVDGKLDFAKSWAAGRLSVKASLTDLWKLRKLL